MPPTTPNPTSESPPPLNPNSNSQPKKPDPKNTDQYAQALATMATLDYKLEEKTQPEQKHIISKKMLVYIILSLVISIITLLAGKLLTRHNTPAQDDQTMQQLLQTTKDVRDLENQ